MSEVKVGRSRIVTSDVPHEVAHRMGACTCHHIDMRENGQAFVVRVQAGSESPLDKKTQAAIRAVIRAALKQFNTSKEKNNA